MKQMHRVPQQLPSQFTVRDLEQWLSERLSYHDPNASRLAEQNLQRWIRNGTVKTSRKRCPIFNIPQYVRAYKRYERF